MKLCEFNNELVCVTCGYKAARANTNRHCRPDQSNDAFRQAVFDQPTIQNLHAFESVPIKGQFQDHLHSAAGVVEPAPTRSAPGFLEKVRNFASAAVDHVAAGMPMASDEEIIRRHDICLTCEHLVDNACTQCGCPVSRVRGYLSKLSWADQECPLGKWGKASDDTPK